MPTYPIVLSAILVASALSAAESPPAAASPAAVSRWQDARFGMFVHWGPVSLKGTEIGWSRGAEVPTEEYDSLYQSFNPIQFNADAWVAVAKAAGMKYLVLTAKHHDGFCLWDTKQTDYNIMHSPFGRDVVKELAAACRKGGIAFGTYYSTCDWHHPAFPFGSPGGKSQKPHPDLTAYDAYLTAQVTELIHNYGPLFTLWFDVPQCYDETYGIPMVRRLRELQPDLMINNRAYSLGGQGSGIGHQNLICDYNTPEQTIGGFDMARPWETCLTLCQQWAWKPDDKMKSLAECLHALIRTNGGNGNLLFNVGPMPDGAIEPRQVARLQEIGTWLAKNGESLYATRGGPYQPTPAVVATRKANKIYLHILKWSGDSITLPALPQTITASRTLAGGKVTHASTATGLTITVAAADREAIDTIVELTLAGPAMDIAPIAMPAAAEPK